MSSWRDSVARRLPFGAGAIHALRFDNEVFAATFAFGCNAAIRLFSSIVLTRLLYPEAYGLVTIIWSVAFIVELVSDLGVVGLMVRHERGDEPHFVNALWTVRFIRGFISFAIVFLAAPLIADLYEVPALAPTLRVFAISFVIAGMESMSFIVLTRRSRARVQSYCDLVALTLSTLFTVAYAYFSPTHYALIYGVLLQRVVMTLFSYYYLPEYRPRFVFDRQAGKDLLGFAKFVMPSSMISMVLVQYERIIFLKLFDLQRLGMFGIASNISGSAESLITRLTRAVLYPRCARHFRESPEQLRELYYTNNVKLFLMVLAIPSAMGGLAHLVIDVLYDPRYAYAGTILSALSIRYMLQALTSTKENLLVAAGHPRVVLVSNVLRLCWLLPASLGGYYFFGFVGFLYGSVLDLLPTLIFSFYVQRQAKLLIVRYEILMIAFMLAVFAGSYALSSLAMKLLPSVRAAIGL